LIRVAKGDYGVGGKRFGRKKGYRGVGGAYLLFEISINPTQRRIPNEGKGGTVSNLAYREFLQPWIKGKGDVKWRGKGESGKVGGGTSEN